MRCVPSSPAPSFHTGPLHTFAASLAVAVHRRAALVCAYGPAGITEVARVAVGAKVTLPAGALRPGGPTLDPMVVDREQMPCDLRWLALQWATPRLLIVPAWFGHDLVAVGAAPAPSDSDLDATHVSKLAAAAADRCAAAWWRDRLLSGAVGTEHRLATAG
jgi:hypothetical protein